jgi:hypothetical protein
MEWDLEGLWSGTLRGYEVGPLGVMEWDLEGLWSGTLRGYGVRGVVCVCWGGGGGGCMGCFDISSLFIPVEPDRRGNRGDWFP